MPPLLTRLHLDRAYTLTRRQWISGVLLFAVYVAAMLASDFLFKNQILLLPTLGISVGILFLEGIELWPFVYLAVTIGYGLSGLPLPFVLLLPAGHAVQAVLGAYLFKEYRLDPLFRRTRDALILFLVIIFISLIVPTLSTIASAISGPAVHTLPPLTRWSYQYTSRLFSLIVFTPFVLRWFSKPWFNRNWIEALEIAGIFIVLCGIDALGFIGGINSLSGIPLVYLVLIPFFWIALRLRPRFVTLAILITSLFGLTGALLGPYPIGSEGFASLLFQTESFIITIAGIFFIIVTLEENRRVNSNLLNMQLATLENAVARVTSESDAKNNFIAMLAHELRNPLAPVLTSIELMQLKEDRDPEEKDTLAMMEDRMHTIKRLLDDLLDISKISEGKLSIRRERADLEDIIDRAVLATAHLIKERHQLFTFRKPRERLVVEGDPVRLEQVFSNLLTNASRYTNSGGQITVTLMRKGNSALIEVKDTGIGIARDSLEHIFLPFHQTEQSNRPKKGLGLGLSIVRSFIELHNGTVIAESAGVGKGSTFTVTLPLAKVD